MKTATIPSLRVEPELRHAVESVFITVRPYPVLQSLWVCIPRRSLGTRASLAKPMANTASIFFSFKRKHFLRKKRGRFFLWLDMQPI